MRHYLGSMLQKPFLCICILLLLPISAQIWADQQDSEASKLLQQADDDVSKSKYNDSIPKYQQAIKLLEQQNDRKGLADAAYKLGAAYIPIGKFTEARQQLNDAFKIHEELKDKSAAGMDLLRLASIESHQANYDAAVELANKALEIQKSIANQKGIADAYLQIGIGLLWQDKYDEGLKNLQSALEIYEATNNKKGITQAYNSIGSIYWRKGDLDQAMEQFNKALSLAEETNNKSLASQILGNMGLIYWNQGDPEKALQNYEKSNAICHEIGNKTDESINLFNMAIVHLESGEYESAQDLYQKSLEMARELGDRGLEGVCLDGLGNVYKNFGNFDVALEYYQKAVKIAEEVGEKRAAAYTTKSIGELYIDKDTKLALEYLQKARQINEEIGEKRGMGIVLDNISELYWRIGKYDLALDSASEALKIYESIGARGQYTWVNRMIGLVHQSKGELQEAEAAFSKSIEFARESGRRDDLWQSLYAKGDVLKTLGKNDEALGLLKESIAVSENLRSEVNTAEQRAEYFQNKIKVYKDAVQILMTKQNLPEAFEYVQRSKARGFLDMLAEARVKQEDILSADLRDRKKKDDNNLRKIQQNIESEYEKETIDHSRIAALEKQRNELEIEYSNLILEIRKQDPRYAEIQYPEPLNLSDAQALLDPDSVLFEYSIGDSASWLFAITADSAAAFEIPPQKKLDDQIHSLREVF